NRVHKSARMQPGQINVVVAVWRIANTRRTMVHRSLEVHGSIDYRPAANAESERAVVDSERDSAPQVDYASKLPTVDQLVEESLGAIDVRYVPNKAARKSVAHVEFRISII